ncbi:MULTISPECIES: hypothetical protein [Streptococcus]|uniref:hypothetical protein n=1 Tax=Streptococcus TaxID=1301 RepID=UPI002A90FAFA|nr:hypothetical protein [Streptococcus orisratti]
MKKSISYENQTDNDDTDNSAFITSNQQRLNLIFGEYQNVVQSSGRPYLIEDT